ncbi:DUF1850 domain-containing protein [Paracoccus xiamenensis]|uniref:DUF1850 domain-containing protein n=1 Tax=Paracoccus xiamenensis TaxID=2714901 RepID=UPI001408D333|nr:DUF1850 domain-containing protein [Paracoccus xiamenensis]NHF72485.1 DUF1850 domain-containing protein [Paracoccus xiamenensis]
MSCLLIGAVAVALSGDRFTLEWTHSVEKTTWREEWVAEQSGLRLLKASIKGSGAGMEPGPDAVLEDGWWVWQPRLPAQTELILAASGATPSAWRFCDGTECRDFGAEPGAAITLRPCPPT